jgi:hypothetical protein
MDEHDRPVEDAATRKLRRLMDEAIGAQHNSLASKALENFNRELVTDYAAANAAAEAEEAGTKALATAAELEAMPAEDETEDEVGDENDSAKGHSRSRRKR